MLGACFLGIDSRSKIIACDELLALFIRHESLVSVCLSVYLSVQLLNLYRKWTASDKRCASALLLLDAPNATLESMH
jgi:hypothetical protein